MYKYICLYMSCLQVKASRAFWLLSSPIACARTRPSALRAPSFLPQDSALRELTARRCANSRWRPPVPRFLLMRRERCFYIDR